MYLEVLLGILLLAIVAGGVIEGFAAASSQIGKTRLDVVASKIAQQHLEDIRNMSYSSVGIVGGNPTGTISASQTQTVNGTAYTVQTSVKYVDDPAGGQPHTHVDYKSVTVVVTPNLTAGLPVTESTIVAPPNYASMAGLSRGYPAHRGERKLLERFHGKAQVREMHRIERAAQQPDRSRH